MSQRTTSLRRTNPVVRRLTLWPRGYVPAMGILIVVLVVLAIIALLIFIFGRGRR